MAEELHTWTPVQHRAHQLLVEHERSPLGRCSCPWGDDLEHLDRSYAEHVVDVLTEAGVFGGPRQHGTIDQLVRDVSMDPTPDPSSPNYRGD